MYLLMINGHIIFVESKRNVFNAATSFNTNAHSCNGDVLMNLNVLDTWYNGIHTQYMKLVTLTFVELKKKTIFIYQM
jgi:hypothetical protein